MDTDEIRTINGICCIQAVEVGRFNSIRDMQRSESDALSYVDVPGYMPCRLASRMSFRILFFALFRARHFWCATDVRGGPRSYHSPPSHNSRYRASSKQPSHGAWHSHIMGWRLTFRSAPTRTADLTHAVLLQDAVPNTDRLSEDGRVPGDA